MRRPFNDEVRKVDCKRDRQRGRCRPKKVPKEVIRQHIVQFHIMEYTSGGIKIFNKEV